MVINYGLVGESGIIRFLIQDIEVYNCIRLCVILFILWYLVNVLDINDVFQIYILSFDYLKEELLLLIMECNIYFSFVVEYVFNY